MPGGDRTGPMGMGPMTGRGLGTCSGRTGSAMYLGGGRFAWGCGMGLGSGRRNRFWGRQPGAAEMPQYEPAAAAQELAELKQQAQILQDSLKDINSRIAQLSKASL
ncbi:MAG: DUF5320 domain-containing protein [Sedimentisphaerales bacterium]|nr:DUF5320 domain-containing protein [Sedimentisphaerales bacterium]